MSQVGADDSHSALRAVAEPARANALSILLLMPAIATSCAFAVQVYLGQGLRPLPALAVGALALMIYALNGVSDRIEDRLNDPAKAEALESSAWRLVAIASAGLLGSTALLAWRGRLFAIYPLILLAGVLYSFRLLPWYRRGRGFTRVRLKDLVLGKNVTIGLTWTSAVFLVPLLDSPARGGPPPAFWMLAAGYALLATTNSIYCDLEDVKGDRAAGVRTLPVVLGPRRCFRLTVIAAALWLLFLLGAHLGPRWMDGAHFLFLAGTAIGYPALVWAARARRLVPSGAISYVIEASDPIFAIGLLGLAWLT